MEAKAPTNYLRESRDTDMSFGLNAPGTHDDSERENQEQDLFNRELIDIQSTSERASRYRSKLSAKLHKRKLIA